MKALLCSLILFSAHHAWSQAQQPPPPEYGWKQSLVAGLTLTQVAFTDWPQGGENALSYTLTANGKILTDDAA